VTQSYFLWPKSDILQSLVCAPRLVSVDAIETRLRTMFGRAHPVLCSSGRAALVLALLETGASRSDLIGVFPYASHCVLEAVSRVATPLAGTTVSKADARIVYHQWGYVQETGLTEKVIEDCVDTLCMPGAELFPAGGKFEIWSLPKILGAASGGVLWCRDARTAERVRALREARGGGVLQWAIRLLSYRFPAAQAYWQGAEGASGYVSRLQTGDIWAALLNWEAIVADRKKKLDLVWPFAVDWLSKPSDRLPPVVPVSVDLPESALRSMGISSGYRMIEKINAGGDRQLARVVPIPIHQEVPLSWLQCITERLCALKRG
jgi:putative PLP-dependent aminotransferase (TIGR04422 family)